MTDIEPLLTKKDVCRILRLCVRTVDYMRKTGKLPSITIGRAIRFKREDVEGLIK